MSDQPRQEQRPAQEPTRLQYMPGPPASAAERVRLAAQRRGESDYIFSYWTALGWTVLTSGSTAITSCTSSSGACATTTHAVSNCSTRPQRRPGSRPGGRAYKPELMPSFQRIAGQLAVLRQMTSEFREPFIWLVLAVVARDSAPHNG